MRRLDRQELIHQEWYKVKGYDVDQHLKMKITSLIQALHDTAIEQVIKLKISATELKPMGLGWVLVNQNLEIFDYPVMGQRIKLKTYPSGKDRLYTYRDYYLHNEDDQLLAQASTAWILMDIKHRRLGDYPSRISQLLKSSNEMPHLPRPRLRLGNGAMLVNEKVFEVQYSDIDFNGHLSNHCFFKWMLDSLPSAFLSAKRISGFEVKFKGEAFEGENVIARHSKIEGANVTHQLTKGGGIIAQGKTIWTNSK